MASRFHKIPNELCHIDDDREKYFEEIYEQYFARLYAYSRAIVDSQSIAKDIVSDLFFKLWNNKTDLNSFENIEMYLYVSVRNLSIRELKKDRRFQSAESQNVKLESIDYIDPQELLIEKELMIIIEKSISRLPDQCQLVFNLSRQCSMKNAEIANELGISVITVRSQIRKAQMKLKTDIVRYYHDKDDSHFPDIRLIGSYLLTLGLIDFDYFN